MSFPLFRAEGLRQQGKNAGENTSPRTEAEYPRRPREERNLQTQRENWQTAERNPTGSTPPESPHQPEHKNWVRRRDVRRVSRGQGPERVSELARPMQIVRDPDRFA